MKIKEDLKFIKDKMWILSQNEIDFLFSKKCYDVLLFNLVVEDLTNISDKLVLYEIIKKSIDKGRFFKDQSVVFFLKEHDFSYYEYKIIQNRIFNETLKRLSCFFEQSSNFEDFNKICKFNCFQEILISKEDTKVNLTNSNHLVFNFNDWTEYFLSLHERFYTDYKISNKHSNKTIKYFLKKINTQFSIGFEVNMKEQKSLIKKGTLDFIRPKIVIIKENNEILYISDLQHPFFFMNCDLLRFQLFSLERSNFETGEFDSYSKDAILKKNIHDLFIISNIDDLGVEYQKMAYFQICLESKVNLEYMDFISQLYVS